MVQEFFLLLRWERPPAGRVALGSWAWAELGARRRRAAVRQSSGAGLWAVGREAHSGDLSLSARCVARRSGAADEMVIPHEYLDVLPLLGKKSFGKDAV